MTVFSSHKNFMLIS